MPNATRSASEAVAWIRHQHDVGSTAWGGMCLSDCRQAWGLPGVYANANEARRHCKKFHKYTGDPDDIPYGAPVWSDRPGGSTYGHIFIAGGHNRQGRRIFWSNDIGSYGRISAVTIDAFRSRWGHEILGWGEDLNGYALNLPKSPNQKKHDEHDKPPVKVDVKGVPGFMEVQVNNLNARSGPSGKAKIHHHRDKGYKFHAVKAVRNDGRVWVRSKDGWWFANEYLDPSKDKIHRMDKKDTAISKNKKGKK
jgi:hypothetical protein